MLKSRLLLAFVLVVVATSFVYAQSALQWDLQEGEGLAVGDALGNVGGTMSDMAHASWQTYPSGESGIQFDNMETEKSILVSNSLVTFGQQFTFEAWVKINAIDTSRQSSIMYLEKKVWNAPKKEQMRGGIKVFKGSDDNHVAVTSFLGFGYDDDTDGWCYGMGKHG